VLRVAVTEVALAITDNISPSDRLPAVQMQDHQINEPKWDAWKVLPEAVRTGQVAFALAHGGLDMHEYDEVKGNEAFADDFQNAMTYYTQQSLMGGDVELQDAYDWRSAKAWTLSLFDALRGFISAPPSHADDLVEHADVEHADRIVRRGQHSCIA